MYIRCAGCGKTTRVWPTDVAVTCVNCSRHVGLDRANELGSTSEERFRRARDFASEKKIDLASAYSVLLGILPIEDALPIHLDDRYDRGFDAAIDEGFLTVQQAVERGDRVLYASTLQQRHGLSMDTAFLVADNRMRLFEALTLQNGDYAPAGSKRPTTRGVWNIAQVAVAFVIVGAGAVALLRRQEPSAGFGGSAAAIAPPSQAAPATSPEPPQPPPVPQANVAFKTDAEGRVTEVSGPDPKTVLLGLCKHTQFAATFSPIALAPSVPPSAGDRLGFVRDSGDFSAQRCVSIHRDFRTGRWFAGDGREPLEIQRAPTLPPGTAITPL